MPFDVSSSGGSESRTILTCSTINSSIKCLERPAVSHSLLEQSMLLSSKKFLQFGNTNARSFKNKTELFIDHLIDKEMDVCVVAETWMNDNDSVTTAPFSPQGYAFRNVPRESDRSGGGTGIIFRDCFNVSLIDSKQRSSFEISEWNIAANGHGTKFVIIYRPPYSEAHLVSANVFFDEFAAYLESIIVCCENLVIAGDFNFHRGDLLDHDAMKFTELLETFGLENHVTFPTHIQMDIGSILFPLALLSTSKFWLQYHLFIYLTTVLLNVV